MKQNKQKQLFEWMEKEFKIDVPIFINSDKGWYDNFLSSAKDLDENTTCLGRYRLDASMNSRNIQEFWFDIEWTDYTESGKKMEKIIPSVVEQRFGLLKKEVISLTKVLTFYLDTLKNVYVRFSGTGVHVFFFIDNFTADFGAVMEFIIKKSGLRNTKGATEFLSGIDKDSCISTKRKLRATYSSNKDKLKKGRNYMNYSCCVTLSDFLKTESYLFCDKIDEVVAPKKYNLYKMPPQFERMRRYEGRTYNNKKTKPVENFRNKGTDKIVDKVKECKALWSIITEPETQHWQARHFLVKNLKYLFGLNQTQIEKLLIGWNRWNDYKEYVTKEYIQRHFEEGSYATQIKKPIKRDTLKRYGYCDGKCRKCVYNIH